MVDGWPPHVRIDQQNAMVDVLGDGGGQVGGHEGFAFPRQGAGDEKGSRRRSAQLGKEQIGPKHAELFGFKGMRCMHGNEIPAHSVRRHEACGFGRRLGKGRQPLEVDFAGLGGRRAAFGTRLRHFFEDGGVALSRLFCGCVLAFLHTSGLRGKTGRCLCGGFLQCVEYFSHLTSQACIVER